MGSFFSSRQFAIGVVIFTLVLALMGINGRILSYETLLKEGQVVRFVLAPVDPRSIMQGDYMVLDYAIARDVRQALRALSFQHKTQPANKPQASPSEMGNEVAESFANFPSKMLEKGELVLELDNDKVAHFKAIYQGQALLAAQIKVPFRVQGSQVKFAVNSFFFEEGQGHHFSQAKYGEFRVSAEGQLLLTHLLDEKLVPL